MSKKHWKHPENWPTKTNAKSHWATISISSTIKWNQWF